MLHDLYRGCRVERARRFIGKQNFRLIDQRPGNRDSLTLPARKLIRPLMIEPLQPYSVERLVRTLDSFALLNSRNRKGKLHVLRNCLVRNQVVALKDKADSVAVGVPIAVGIILCTDSVDKQLAVRIMIQSADDVEERRFPASRRAEY